MRLSLKFFSCFLSVVLFSSTTLADEQKKPDSAILNAVPAKLSKTKVPTLEELRQNTYSGKPLLFGNFPDAKEKSARHAPSSADLKVAEMQARREKMEQEIAERNANTTFFSSRLQEQLMREAQAREEWENYQKNKVNYLPLMFKGDKTVIRIPPDNLVEVPLADHIAYFFTRIEIMADGSVTVHETIQRIVSKKTQNFYGLNRYFPYSFVDRAGKKRKTHIHPMAATHNDQEVKAELYPSMFGLRVKMEDEKPLSPGVHVYRWSYRMEDKISDFGDFKELVWSVTGNQWFFPVTRAGVHIIFPQKTEVISQSAKTGNYPLTDDLYRTKRDANGDISFTLQYPVGAGEDFMVMANYKEHLPSFVPHKTVFDFFGDEYASDFMAVIMFLLVLSYYGATWFSIRRNQISSLQNMKPSQKNDIIPAVVRFAVTKKIDVKNFFILILSMAGKGFLACKELPDGNFQLIKKTDKPTNLLPMEKKIASALFQKKETAFTVSDANALKLTRLFETVIKMIRKDYADKYVTVYITYFLFGLLMTLLSVGVIAGTAVHPVSAFFSAVTIMAFSVAMYLIVCKMIADKRAGKKIFAMIPFVACLMFFAVPCLTLLWFFSIQTSMLTALFFAMTLVCIMVFYSLLKSPSTFGRSVLDTLDAYKVYLSSSSESPFTAMRDAVGKLRLLYDKHLPFATALDLDKEWTQKMLASSDESEALKPSWYVGKMPFNEDFIKNLYESFALHFPKKTYYFGDKRVSENRSRPRMGASRFGKK